MSFLGGPTIFYEASPGRWGEYLLPEGIRIENGDKVKIEDCKFLGVWYKPLEVPRKESFPNKEEWREAVNQVCERMKKDDVRVTFTGKNFLALAPIEENAE